MSVTTARRATEQSVTAYQNLIGGGWQPASDGRTLDMISPSDGQAFARIARGTKADIDAAVRAARHAFEAGAWGKLTAVERGRLMTKLGEAILVNHEELSLLEARDCGKPMKQARADITAAARYFEYYGGAADKYHGDTIPFLDGYMVTILREPKGVTGHIIPWNYPAQMFGRSLAPALAMGNAVVMKPAEDACVTPVRLAQLAQEVGFAPGALNVVTGIGEEAGAALASHPGIDFLSFTGSPEVGTLVQKAAAENHIGCTLELGGKSPQIVFEDADFDAAVPVVVNAIVQNGGQPRAGAKIHLRQVRRAGGCALQAIARGKPCYGPGLRPSHFCQSEQARARLHRSGEEGRHSGACAGANRRRRAGRRFLCCAGAIRPGAPR